MSAILRVRDAEGNITEIPALKGESAYLQAQQGGYTGTEEEFKAKLAQEIPTATSDLTNDSGFITSLADLGISASAANINQTAGATSNIQTQINTINTELAKKPSLSGGHLRLSGNLIFNSLGETQDSIGRGVAGFLANSADAWRIVGNQTGPDAGYTEWATAGDGDEPLYVRQFKGSFSASNTVPYRSATLLDAEGNTSFPGNITAAGGFTGDLTGNATTATTASKVANSLAFKVNGTSLYSFNGSAARTINLIGAGRTTITNDSSGNITITTPAIANASSSASGLMSSTDKAKLDAIEASADAVSFSRTLSSGTKIGTITINGTATDIYAETNTDSDANVVQNLDTSTSQDIPVLMSYAMVPTSGSANIVKYTSEITINPSTGTLKSTRGGFAGNLTGNASSATKATKDSENNVIVDTYSAKPNTLKGASASGKTITFTKGDGSTFTITTQDTTYSAATTSAAGLMSAADKTKLDGIEAGAEVNQNAFSNVVVGSTTIAADSKTDTITLVAGDNITLTPNATNDSITITAKDDNTTYSNATTSAAGLMSAADKTKLNGIEAGAQVNTVTSVAGKVGPVELSKSDVGLGNVTNESKATMFISAALTGTPTAPTATTGTNTTQIATTAFVNATVNNKIAAADAMIYKGTIGTGGTVTSLPATHKTGWTYKVATAGTYAGVVCEVGDLIICLTDGTTSTNSHWTVVQTNVDGTVTGPASAVANRVAVFDGTTGKIIKDSGYTIAKSVPSDAKFTDTTYSFSTSNPTLAWGTTSTIGSAGGVTYTVTMPANPNSHYTTKMYATSSAGTAHATTTNGNTYLRLFDNTTARSSINIKGSGATTVTSNDSGVITISSTNTTYSNATTGSAGLMSAADKTKLDGIANNANNYTYTLPNATSSTLGGVKIGSNITVSSGTISLTKANVTNALGYTPPTTNTTYSAGDGLSLENSTTFHVGAGEGIAVNANSVALSASGVTAGSYGPSANATPGYGATFNVPYITVDAYGRVTGASTKTVKIPASDNTDAKVTQTVRTTNGAFPLLLRGTSAGTSTVTTTTSFASSITANPSTGTVAATIFDASTEVDIGDCKLVYDSTNKCLNFVF